jgi:hypothetical protein
VTYLLTSRRKATENGTLHYPQPTPKYFNFNRYVIWVNGVKNTGQAHREAALAIAQYFQRTCIGVYNKTDGAIKDLFVQVPLDKLTSARGTVRSHSVDTRRAFNDDLPYRTLPHVPMGEERLKIVEKALASNPATLQLFRLLRLPQTRNYPLIAHSQGNFIASNALEAVDVIDGRAAIAGREVRSYGTPCWWWPSAIRATHCNYNFTTDLVSMAAPFAWVFGRSSTSCYHGLWAHSFTH